MNFSSLCSIAIKIDNSVDGRKETSKHKKMKHLKWEKKWKVIHLDIFPLSSGRLEIVPLISHSTLYSVVDFSPASHCPPPVTAIARVRFLASMKRNPLAMSLDPKGVSERGRNCY